jgi:cyclopropane-fatty-acyl-phospholipid synthase
MTTANISAPPALSSRGSRAQRAEQARAWYEPVLDRGLIPDALLRRGIRKRLGERLARERAGGPAAQTARKMAFIESLRESPIAIETDAANEQHYELPPEFFTLCLGPWLKYSCGLWEHGARTLGDAEERMLETYGARARIEDGMRILDLGCGWGSFTRWAAKRYPKSEILAVSNSALQRRFIEGRLEEEGLTNVRVLTRDANEFDPGETFDRIVSVEMLEHMKNYQRLFGRIASWLAPDGLFFTHIFTHREVAYPFEVGDDWIGRYFFTGGCMPSEDLFHFFQDDLRLHEQWCVDGTHYAKTAEAWLVNLDQRKDEAMRVLAGAYGENEATKWFVRWRVFFLACAELWGYAKGTEWTVSHYLFAKR